MDAGRLQTAPPLHRFMTAHGHLRQGSVRLKQRAEASAGPTAELAEACILPVARLALP